MDINEFKKFSINKILSDDLTKYVRNVIKEAEWKKQDNIENLTETFKPLIESQYNIKKSIDNQQDATINLQNATINKQNEIINQLQNNQTDIKELIEQIIQNRRNNYRSGSDDGSDGSDDDDDDGSDNDTIKIQNNQNGIKETINKIQNSQTVIKELIEQIILNRRNSSGNEDDSDNDTSKIQNNSDNNSDVNSDDNIDDNIDSEFDSNIRRRLNELSLLDNQFNKNLTYYDSIKILANHDFYSFPSDYLQKSISDIEQRKYDVKSFLLNYYTKLQNYANFYNDESNTYSLAKIKDEILQSKSKKLLNYLKNEIQNYNVLSVYFTNLDYVEKYKNNELSNN